jgi:hypothetical protein
MATAEFNLDPTDHYKNSLGDDWQARVVDAVGVLPEFAFGPHESVSQNMQENYQFFMSWSHAGDASVEDDCFCFPGDEPLPPLLKIECGEETVFIYPHCIVAVCTEGDLLKYTRMD